MSGTMREKRPDVWELRAAVGKDRATGHYRQVSRTFHGKKRAASKALAALVAEIESGAGASSRGTFGYLLDEWFAVAEPDLSPTTAREYRRLIEKELRPVLGAVPLAELTPGHFNRLYAELAKPRQREVFGQPRTLKPLAPGSVAQVHAIARRSLNEAIRWDWITSNAASKARPPRRHKREVTPPTVAAMLGVFKAADEHDPDFAVFLRVKLALGCRRGEICGLRWTDVDLDGGLVTIRRAVVDVAGHLVEKDTKTHAIRKVAIDGPTVDLLREHRARVDERAEFADVELTAGAFVFSRAADGLKPIRPENATDAFVILRKAAGLEGVRLHDLRHLNASLLLAAGVPLHTVSKRLGHAKASTTLDIYGHMMPETDRAAADIIGQLLAGEPKALPPAEVDADASTEDEESDEGL